MSNKLAIIIFVTHLSLIGFGQVNANHLQRNEDGRVTKIGDFDPYSGDFIEYFLNKKVKAIGTYKYGLLEGLRIEFNENGDTAYFRNYSHGNINGHSKEFHANNKIKEEGDFVDGNADGTWTYYFRNGKPRNIINYKEGVPDSESIEYKMDGTLKAKDLFKYEQDSFGSKINDLVEKALKHSQKNEIEEAIKCYDNAIKINPTIAKLYLNRGTLIASLFDISFLTDAIKDFDKAIELNPNYIEAYIIRGNTIIHQLARNGNMSPNLEQTKSACEDFQKAIQLGDNTIETEDSFYLYCTENK